MRPINTTGYIVENEDGFYNDFFQLSELDKAITFAKSKSARWVSKVETDFEGNFDERFAFPVWDSHKP